MRSLCTPNLLCMFRKLIMLVLHQALVPRNTALKSLLKINKACSSAPMHFTVNPIEIRGIYICDYIHKIIMLLTLMQSEHRHIFVCGDKA